MKKNGGSKHREKPEKKEEKEEKEEKKEKQHRNNKRGTGTGKVSELFISNIKTPFDEKTGEYVVSFILDESAKRICVGIKIGSDDDNLAKAEVARATMNNKTLTIKNGMVEIGSGSKGQKKIMRVKLSETKRKSLEVRAYAEH